MITFLISLAALVLGYLVYGRFVERIFAPDDRVTPAVAQADGLDYVAMPYWKVFMIQFLNIAGTGPIFGAIMGAKFGPAAYLWIIFGCIFAGAVHDYFVGMLSMTEGYTESYGKTSAVYTVTYTDDAGETHTAEQQLSTEIKQPVIAGEKTDAEKQAEEEQKRAMSQWWISALAAFAVIAIIVAVIVVSKFARMMKVR